LRGAPVVRGPPEPLRCAPCTPERLSGCPAVAPGCREVLREAGCGCCPVCALGPGEPCGIYTAPCGSGSKCTPRPGDPRPLLSLTRGQAQCPGPRSTAGRRTSHTLGSEDEGLCLQVSYKVLLLSLRPGPGGYDPRPRAPPPRPHQAVQLGPGLRTPPPRPHQAPRPAGGRRRAGEHESHPQETAGETNGHR